jgi:hypothetical protein
VTGRSASDGSAPPSDREIAELLTRRSRFDRTGLSDVLASVQTIVRETPQARRSGWAFATGRQSLPGPLRGAGGPILAVTGSIVTIGVVAALVVGPLMSRPAASAEPTAETVAGTSTGRSPISASSSPALTSSSSPATAVWRALTWTPTDPQPFAGPGNQFIVAVAGYGSGFVAVGFELVNDHHRAIAWQSDDGRSWVREPDVTGVFADATVDGMAVNGSSVIVWGARGSSATSLGQPIMWRSANGRVWQATTPPSDAELVGGVVPGPGGFLAWMSALSTVWASSDGSTWRAVANIGRPGEQIRLLDTTGNGYLAVVSSGKPSTSPTSAYGLWSPDGESWGAARIPKATGIGPVFVGRDGMLLSGSTSSCTGCVAPPDTWHSTDGRTWTPLSTGTVGSRYGDQLFDVDGRIFDVTDLVGQPAEGVATSTDGLAWTTIPTYLDQGIRSATATFGSFYRFAAGVPGIVATSQPQGATGGSDETDGFIWLIVPGAPPTGARLASPVPQASDIACPGTQPCGP